MSSTLSVRLRVLASAAAFVGVFAAGFFERPPNFFLLPLGALVVAGGSLVVGGRPDAGVEGRRAAMWTGGAAMTFASGLLYGAGGIWWGYDVNDVIYLGITGPSALAFVCLSGTWLWRSRGHGVDDAPAEGRE